MSFNQLISSIYNITGNGIKIWLEDKKIKLFVPVGLVVTEDQKSFIKDNREAIINILEENNIYSKEYDILILKAVFDQTTLSFAQERLWFIEKYEQGTNAYNIPIILELTNGTSIEIMEKSIKEIINRHEILRTVIQENKDGSCYQDILYKNAENFAISKFAIADKEELHHKLQERVNLPFNLSNSYPIRVDYYKVDSVGCYLSIVLHHIAFDGWSGNVFLHELQQYYNYFLSNKPTDLEDLAIQYKDFALWQKSYLDSDNLNKQLEYWQNKLSDYQMLDLKTDKVRPPKIDYSGADIHFSFDNELANILRETAKKQSVSLYSLCLAGCYILFKTYSNQNDIILGTPVANRHYQQLEPLIGFFVNVLALRVEINPNISISEFIKIVGEEVVSAQLNQDLPFEKLVEELGIEQDVSRHPIFQIMFMFESETEKESQNNFFNKYAPEEEPYNIAKFDLSIFIKDDGKSVTGSFNYATSIYESVTIERLIESYKEILRIIAKSSNKKLSEISILSTSAYQQIINDWNKTDQSYPSDKRIEELFVEQVGKTPDKVALVYEDVVLTYQELHNKSNQLAHYLSTEYFVKLEEAVILFLERSEYMFTSILGVFKTGGTYVPIDPEYPKERIEYILFDTGAKVIITDSKSADKLPNSVAANIVVIDSDGISSKLAGHSSDNLPIKASSNNLAYIIYTSGTTGQPKGVMVEHQGVVNTIYAINDIYDLSKGDKVTAFTSYVFDVSVSEFFTALLRGGELHLMSKTLRLDTDLISKYIKDHEINYVYLPPILLANLPREEYRSIKAIIYAGEPCDIETGKYWSNNYKLYNYYGPTEASIYASGKQIINGDTHLIGKPIANGKCYVLDDNLNPLPIGAVGELYLGGGGIARGYLNKKELTKEKFIDNPFAEGRLYKTGDLVRYQEDGNIEYLGRNDFQLKIRGFRIELSEIEAAIANHPNIKQSVVLAKEAQQNKYLVGYYTANKDLDDASIIEYISVKLPDYMIPAILMQIEEMPLTINGKLDRKKLPQPEFDVSNRESKYIAPQTEDEKALVTIWSETLSIPKEKISINDNFFRLGGNSLLAIRLTARTANYLNTEVPVALVFKYSSIKKLLANIDRNQAQKINKYDFTAPSQQVLSFAQERFWFIDQYEQGTNIYNVPMIFKIKEGTNLDILEKSFNSIIERHEILRTIILSDTQGSGYQQLIDVSAKPFSFLHSKLEDKQSLKTKLTDDVNHVFNLSSDYPIRVSCYKVDNKHYLSVVIHHIAFDGWSTGIFLNEIKQYYDHYLQGKELSLPILAIQYKDFAVWQRNYAKGTSDELSKYWQKQLIDYQNLRLPIDKNRPDKIDYSGENIYIKLDIELSKELRKLAKKLNVSLYSLTLSAYLLMLKAYSGQTDIVVGIPVAGRDHSQTEDLIGLFINSLPLRIKIDTKTTLKDFCLAVSKQITEIQLYQEFPFEQLVKENCQDKAINMHSIFQTMFGMHGFGITQEQELSNLLQGYASEIEQEYNVARYDLSCFLDDSEESIAFDVNYATSLFTNSTISQLIDNYKLVLSQLVQIDKNIHQINYLSKPEYKKLIEGWNDNIKDYGKVTNIVTLFEEQVKKTPDKIAVLFHEQELSYKDLNVRANKIAYYLRDRGCSFEIPVILYLNRGIDMVVAILGVLKAGGTYTPVDPSSPDERNRYVIDDVQADLILINDSNYVSNQPEDKTVINITDVINSNIDSDNLNLNINKTNAAYIIYTSGTTGKPKGVVVEHQNVFNYFHAISEYCSFTTSDKYLMVTDYIFDLGYTCFWSALLGGGQLHLIQKNKMFDTNFVREYINKYKISVLKMTPLYFQSLLYEARNHVFCNDIKVILGGEKLTSDIISDIKNKDFTNLSIYNHYGPTEATVGCIAHKLDDKTKYTTSVIGKPLKNYTAYILNEEMQPVPTGSVGKLYIGGAGVARGYYNKPELTKEKFVNNPFDAGKLYDTGDLVRYRLNGDIEYIGRNDFQLKIRGFRVEIGEIESILVQNGDIEQAAVKAFDNDNNIELVGYIVAGEFVPTETEITEYLKEKLPDYMIPQYFVFLEKLPLTNNGKLDRKALPELKKDDTSYIAPTNHIERKVCLIWAEMLNLPIEKVGIRDNFFTLGGNSILAIKLVSKINNDLSYNISIADIFQNDDIESLVKSFGETDSKQPVIEQYEVEEEKQLLSFAQERLWFIEKFEQGSNAYNIPLVFKLANTVNLNILKQSIKSLISRHEILRSVIREDKEGNGYQKVLDINFVINHLSVNSKSELNKRILQEQNHFFDFSLDPPIRVISYQLEQVYYLSIVVHHIAFDGWSVQIFLDELEKYYYHHLNNTKLTIPDLTIQYRDFALWQRSYLSGKRLSSQMEYWSKELSGYQTLQLASDYPRPMHTDYKGADFSFELDLETSKSLRLLAKQLKVSLFSLLLSAYYLMLKFHSNQNDITLGIPIANRHYNQTENIIGCFINSLSLRFNIDENQIVSKFIKQVGDKVVTAQLHQDLPFEKVVEMLNPEKDTSRHPIFQVMFEVRSFTENENSLASVLSPYELHNKESNVAKFDLNSFVDDSDDLLKGNFNYATSIYSSQTMSRFADTYISILQQFAKLSPGQSTLKVQDINHISQSEYQKIVYDWNNTEKDYPSDSTIHQLFEKQVAKTPNNVAVSYGDISLTYRELNEKANQLAHYILKNKGDNNSEMLVAIGMRRSHEMLITILAVLKAGGAYVSMDPSYPVERLQYMLADSKAPILVTESFFDQKFTNYQGIKIKIDQWDIIEKEPKGNPDIDVSSNDLAYIIYTSGTTGKPKGVMIEHRGKINHLYAVIEGFNLKESDIVGQTAPPCFDISVWQFLAPLMIGAKVCVFDIELIQDATGFLPEVEKQNVTILQLVPTFIEAMLELFEHGMAKDELDNLKLLITTGEAVSSSLCKKWFKQFSIPLLNAYGPAECSDDLTFYCMGQNTDLRHNIPIGFPVQNLHVYILDEKMRPVPIGVVGEIYVGGDGVARGYLNKEELTKEKFIDNPFASNSDKLKNRNLKLYKSGDLARWLDDGNIEFLGRNDFQVKIRGQRLELSEIESVLSEYPGIKQNIVAVKYRQDPDGAKDAYLVGYYISDQQINNDEVKEYLQEKLPEQMIPSALMQIDEMPLTPNGKIDRKALPEIELEKQEYVAPRNDLEAKICSIWSDVLSINKDYISIKDDFFKLGGSSILAIKLVARINNYCDANIKIVNLFMHRTIEELVHKIESLNDQYQAIVKLNDTHEKTNMFLIHPGEGGCEVYISLANKLSDEYSCYGVDSYNLYHDQKIDNISQLAEYYLKYIENVMHKTNQDKYYLLGWSLGGKIAIEIASILESRGVTNIEIILLDVRLRDSYLIQKSIAMDLGELRQEYITSLIQQGHDQHYAQSAALNLDIDEKLANQQITNKLSKSSILLFKAMQNDTTTIEAIHFRKIQQYILSLKYNNVDMVVENIDQINLVKLDKFHHGNILDAEEIIISHLNKTEEIA